ncbi:MAG: S41 family peptidase, partial [Planctomycetota bacterium]
GSPAFRAGIMAEDRVLEVDGASTRGLSVTECIDMIKGEPGTTVSLRIERDGETEVIDIVRDRIRTPAVRGIHRLDDATWQYLIDTDRGVAFIRLSQFTPTSAAAFRTAIEAAEAEARAAGHASLGGLVIDLRFNPGGLLDQAVRIADFFLGGGTIVSTRGRPEVFPEERFEARDEATDRDYPIAFILNGQSASASEVLAGALAENDRAIVVGTRSFGKGSVQSVRGLTGSAAGALLKLTEQRYYLPSGRSIQRTDDAAEWGVDPTPGFFVPMTNEQTRAMLTARRQEEIIGEAAAANDGDAPPTSIDWSDADAILEKMSDPQLASAVRALQSRVDAGEWAAIDGTANNNTAGDAAATAIQPNPATVAALTNALTARERILRELGRIDRRVDTLEAAVGAAASAEAETAIDLIPGDPALAGGTLRITDASGEVVTELRITGENLERWLIDAGVEPIDPLPSLEDANDAQQ